MKRVWAKIILTKNYVITLFNDKDKRKKKNKTSENIPGVPVVAQWLTNLIRNHEVAGSIPG